MEPGSTVPGEPVERFGKLTTFRLGNLAEARPGEFHRFGQAILRMRTVFASGNTVRTRRRRRDVASREETDMAFLRQLLSRENKIQIIGTWDL